MRLERRGVWRWRLAWLVIAGLIGLVGLGAKPAAAEVEARAPSPILRLPQEWTTGDELAGPPPPCTDCGPQNIKPRKLRKKPRLTETEREILARGEIGSGPKLSGPLFAATIGFGFGQAAQGRWRSAGWIFALGEPGALLLSYWGVSTGGCGHGNGHSCSKWGFFVPFLLVRTISVLDTVLAPATHNAELKKIRAKLKKRKKPPKLQGAPFLVPAEHGDGAMAGVVLRF